MFDMVKAERFCHIYTGIEDSCEHGSRDEIPCGVWGRAQPIQITKSELDFEKQKSFIL